MCQASLCLWNMVAILPIVSRLSPFAYWWCLRHIARHRFLSHFVTWHCFGVESPSDTLSMLIWRRYKSLPKRAVAWEGLWLWVDAPSHLYGIFCCYTFLSRSVLEIMDRYFSGLPFPSLWPRATEGFSIFYVSYGDTEPYSFVHSVLEFLLWKYDHNFRCWYGT